MTALKQLLGEQDICLCFTGHSVLGPRLERGMGLGSNSSETACYMAFVFTKPPIAVEPQLAESQLSGLWHSPLWVGGKGGERVSVVKFPFRHLSLAGFVTGEFCVFSHFHLPWGDPWGPSSGSPPLERQQGGPFGFLGVQLLSAGLGWAQL